MLPILFTSGPFNVYAFGFFLAISFLLSTFIIFKYAKEELKEEEYLDAFLYTNLAALVSARAVYIIFNFDQFSLNLLRYIVVRETPGLSLLGGAIGGFAFLWWYTKKKKSDFLHLLDLFSLAASFSLFFAKIGEQLGGAGFGRETSFILGVRVIGLSGRRHPVELYEAVFYFLLSVFLFWIYKKFQREKWPTGLLFCLFAVASAVFTFLIEFLKVYKVYLYGLSARQISFLVIIILIAKPLFLRLKSFKIRQLL